MREFRFEDLASLACELPEEVLRYRMSGNLAEADEAIDRWLAQPIAEELKTRLRVEKKFLEILPQQFPYTTAEVVKNMQEKVPSFSEKDLDRLDKTGYAEWVWIEGEKHYIHNIVRNIVNEDAETVKILGIPEEDVKEKEMLKEEIALMKQKGSSSWKYRIRATIRLKDEEFVPGMKVRVHMPLPAKLFQVKSVTILDYDKSMKVIDPEDELRRTIYFEDTLLENREFFVEYEYEICAVYHDLWSDEVMKNAGASGTGTEEKALPEDAAECLKEQYPHIRFSPYIRALADEIVGDETIPLEKARRIYDYVTKNVHYSFMREYMIIEDIPQYCARNLRGDCGVQALLFITLCRAAGVPARWQSGLYSHPMYCGSHDWALFYAEPYGWLFADLSFGGSAFRDGDEDRRRFYFGNLEPFRMPANNAFQHPFTQPKNFWPLDPYDSQQGEMESEKCGYLARHLERKPALLKAERIEDGE